MSQNNANKGFQGLYSWQIKISRIGSLNIKIKNKLISSSPFHWSWVGFFRSSVCCVQNVKQEIKIMPLFPIILFTFSIIYHLDFSPKTRMRDGSKRKKCQGIVLNDFPIYLNYMNSIYWFWDRFSIIYKHVNNIHTQKQKKKTQTTNMHISSQKIQKYWKSSYQYAIIFA